MKTWTKTMKRGGGSSSNSSNNHNITDGLNSTLVSGPLDCKPLGDRSMVRSGKDVAATTERWSSSLYKPSPRISQRLEKMKRKTCNKDVNQLTEPVSPFNELMRYRDDIKVDEVVFDKTCTIATKTKSSSPVYFEHEHKAKERRQDNVNDDIEGRDPDHDVSRSGLASDVSRHGRDGGGESGGGEEYLHQYYPQYGHLQHLYISHEKKNNRRRCDNNSNRPHHQNHQSRKKSDNRKSGKSATSRHHKPSEDDPHQVPVYITVPGIIESTESRDTSEISLDDTLWTTKAKTKPNSSNVVKISHAGKMKSKGTVPNEDDELFTLVSSSRKLSFDTRDNEDMSQFDYPDPPLDTPVMKVTIINDFWPSDEELDVSSPQKKKYSDK